MKQKYTEQQIFDKCHPIFCHEYALSKLKDDDSSSAEGHQHNNHRVKSLTDFSHWVVRIIFHSSNGHRIEAFKNSNILFAITRDNISLHSWQQNTVSSHFGGVVISFEMLF